MAVLHPFRALRPVPEKVEEVASVPYDVISSDEARRMADGKPLSFLHVIRPEIDLPEGLDEHDDRVYEKGAETLRRFSQSPHWMREAEPSVYVYRLIMGEREQTGLFACVSVDDYDRDVILKHEKTRIAKEDDRTRHILEQQAHAEPVMLAFRGTPESAALMNEARSGRPLYDFTADDGVRHTLWRAPQPQPFVEAFASVERLYVADGHHRCKAASRAAETLPGEGEHRYFPAVLFPMDEMLILPYNRIIYELPYHPVEFLDRLEARMPVWRNGGAAAPDRKGRIGLYLEGAWRQAELPETRRPTVADRLDVARLNEHVLEPILKITDPRTDPNIDFVGGIRGAAELEHRVDSGEAQLAIAMYPTSIEELVAVSDAGLLMPPKSTWFEPKLRSGLLVHPFDS